MKFDDLVYNILEQERKGGGKLLAGAALGAAGTYAALNPEKTAGLYQQHVAPHVNKALGVIGGKQAHAAGSPNHPTEPQHREPGPSHAPKTHHPTEPQHREPGPSHAPPHDIELPDYVSGT
jgi:hypothetical protein